MEFLHNTLYNINNNAQLWDLFVNWKQYKQ